MAGLLLTHSSQPLGLGHVAGQVAPASSSLSSLLQLGPRVLKQGSPSLRIILPLMEFLLSERVQGRKKSFRRTKAGAWGSWSQGLLRGATP